MLTKGIVIKVDYPKLKVRLPIFESPGSNQKQIIDCSVCVETEVLDYKKDDIVWVGFEDNKISNPVVLGKLYQKTSEREIKLSDFIKDGQIDLTYLKNTIDYFESYIHQLQEELAELKAAVPANQATFTIVIDALTNINGRVLSNYEAVDFTYADVYPVKIIKYMGETCTEEEARNYMEYMTGSRFLPKFDYQRPQNSIWVMNDHTFWKPQYDDEYGMVLYKINVQL